MIYMYAPPFYGTFVAILTAVVGYLALESGSAFAGKFSACGQSSVLGTKIDILSGHIFHVFPAFNVLLPFSRLALFIFVGLYKGTLLVCFRIMDKFCGVRWLRADNCLCDEFGIRAVLDVIGRF